MGILKRVGLWLYFAGIGFWIILFFSLSLWLFPIHTLVFFFFDWLARTLWSWPGLKYMNVWQWLRDDYFKFVQVGELPDAKVGPVIYAIYPHGHYSLTTVLYFALNPTFAISSRPAAHTAAFYVPILASICAWIRAISVTKHEMQDTLESGTSIYMCPGGVSEIALRGKHIVKRNGFLNVAKEAGAKVVPVWCPQERSYYSHWLPLRNWLVPIFSFPLPILIWGTWWCPMLPMRPQGASEVRFGPAMDPSNVEAFWAEMDKLQCSEKGSV